MRVAMTLDEAKRHYQGRIKKMRREYKQELNRIIDEDIQKIEKLQSQMACRVAVLSTACLMLLAMFIVSLNN